MTVTELVNSFCAILSLFLQYNFYIARTLLYNEQPFISRNGCGVDDCISDRIYRAKLSFLKIELNKKRNLRCYQGNILLYLYEHNFLLL